MRIGVLGAARIAPAALMKPARMVDGVSVAAIAARDPQRARAFAAKFGVATVHQTYADLIADESLDAVYIPLPNGLHHEWTLAALRAGKHVLCEKPFTSNGSQAREIAAGNTDRVVMEAFHYRYHPLAKRMQQVVHGGELGEIKQVRTWMCFPLPRFGDIRYNFSLAGGALMDAGCYAVHCLRLLAPGTPRVTGAQASPLRRDPRIDRAMRATFDFDASPATGAIHTSMWSSTLLRIRAEVEGSKGRLVVNNFAVPQLPSRFTVEVAGRRRRETFDRQPTYVHQLRAFVAAVRGDSGANLTPPADSVATMSLIDDIYTAAGMPLRA